MRLEHLARFRQRTERGPRATELLRHLLQFARLLNRPQRHDGRVEQVEQHEQAVLIEMQRAIVGLVASAAHVVQPRKDRLQAVQVLEPAQIFLTHFRPPLATHERHLDRAPRIAQA
jgi:hypothetical protein